MRYLTHVGLLVRGREPGARRDRLDESREFFAFYRDEVAKIMERCECGRNSRRA